MVGGVVIEVCDDPECSGLLYVNVADRPYSKLEECAIYVARNEHSERIEIGDRIWWQGSVAMWTPAEHAKDGTHGKRCGVDYDIQIPRHGYSGVSHPWF